MNMVGHHEKQDGMAATKADIGAPFVPEERREGGKREHVFVARRGVNGDEKERVGKKRASVRELLPHG